jgi:hypothetical protein
VRLPRCRRPASYSGQFAVLYECLTYLAWLRLKAVIGESELGEYTETVIRNQESRTKAPEAHPNQAFQVTDRVVGLEFDREATVDSVSAPAENGASSSTAGPVQQTPEQLCREAALRSEATRSLLVQVLEYLAEQANPSGPVLTVRRFGAGRAVRLSRFRALTAGGGVESALGVA